MTIAAFESLRLDRSVAKSTHRRMLRASFLGLRKDLPRFGRLTDFFSGDRLMGRSLRQRRVNRRLANLDRRFGSRNFIDDLLEYLYEAHPTSATLDGVHTHDDLLEDFSRQTIESESHALAGYLRRLDEIRVDGLTATERLEHRMLAANLRSRMFDLEEIRTWEKNPQHYADTLASSIAGQALFTHAPAAEDRKSVV